MGGRRTILICVLALLAAACSGSDGDKQAETPPTTAPLGPRVDVGKVEAPERCDSLDTRHCLLPFPSDTFTVDDASTDTGKRVAFARASMPANNDGVHADPTEWNRNDGFSPGQAISLFVPGLDVEASGIPNVTNIAASLAPDAAIVLVDATTGDRHPYWAELDASVENDIDRVLYIRPAVNFPEGHRIVVGMRGLKNAGGQAIEPQSKVFLAYRDRNDTGNPVLEARRARYETVFGDLTKAGLDRSTLYLAWDFTIASERNLSERMLKIRDDAFTALGDAAPEFTIDNVEPGGADGQLASKVMGTVKVPLYLTGTGEPGSRLVGGEAGELPARNGDATYDAPFICIIPKQALVQPARISLYGHGLLGDPDEVDAGNVQDMAQEHNVVFCATAWIGMAANDIPNAIAILGDIGRFASLADRSQQGFLNALFLARVMKHPDGLSSNEAFAGRLDTSEVYYDGNSQGGIMGGALTAVSTDITRSVLGVPGMNYSTLLQRSVDWDTYRLIYEPAYPTMIERGIGISLIQMLWDRAEANGYALHMTSDPLPNTPAHEVLMHVAFGDHQVSQYAAEVEARTIGAHMYCPPTADARLPGEPHWNLECVGSDRVDGSVLVIWDSGAAAPPIDNRAPSEGEDPHGDPRSSPAARRQKSEFLAADGLFVDECGAEPCRAEPS
jgi:hypothetical protein